jgi:endonuclease/exonuclease/phosphatase family metal-dependent hydrolase
MDPLRIVTINTGKCDGPYQARTAWLAEEVARLRPDVLVCQEVFREDNGPRDTLAVLQRKLGLQASWAPARFKLRECEGVALNGWSGMALLSRYAWAYVDVLELPADDRDGERLAQIALLEVGETSVVVANVHLTHLRDADKLRGAQLDSVLCHPLMQMRKAIRLICGDLNMTPENPVLSRMLSSREAGSFIDTYVQGHGEAERGTLPRRGAAKGPQPCVDYILSLAEADESQPVFTSSAVVLKNSEPSSGVLPSDHYGVATTLVPLRVPGWRGERTLVG